LVHIVQTQGTWAEEKIGLSFPANGVAAATPLGAGAQSGAQSGGPGGGKARGSGLLEVGPLRQLAQSHSCVVIGGAIAAGFSSEPARVAQGGANLCGAAGAEGAEAVAELAEYSRRGRFRSPSSMPPPAQPLFTATTGPTENGSGGAPARPGCEGGNRKGDAPKGAVNRRSGRCKKAGRPAGFHRSAAVDPGAAALPNLRGMGVDTNTGRCEVRPGGGKRGRGTDGKWGMSPGGKHRRSWRRRHRSCSEVESRCPPDGWPELCHWRCAISSK
jgi:hypothetical protein